MYICIYIYVHDMQGLSASRRRSLLPNLIPALHPPAHMRKASFIFQGETNLRKFASVYAK